MAKLVGWMMHSIGVSIETKHVEVLGSFAIGRRQYLTNSSSYQRAMLRSRGFHISAALRLRCLLVCAWSSVPSSPALVVL